MKTINIVIIVFGILIISGLIYLIAKSAQRESIKQAAINSGISPTIATNVSQATDSRRALMSLRVPNEVATLISLGTSVQGKEIYKCTHTDSKGNITTYDGHCTQVDANNGWVTSSI